MGFYFYGSLNKTKYHSYPPPSSHCCRSPVPSSQALHHFCHGRRSGSRCYSGVKVSMDHLLRC
ncbi:hypothetical protein SLEP1_g12278 [Rubroshorea leprosula]|uniref:Uncharacterized protein n=1 Tax=Rubroshorea leprosula TaxID=152421 RepID=A0AAV5IHW7_9ROSI|nr:hypothetical protein SLEP1_g12278 [Rubroshorea leprosula]